MNLSAPVERESLISGPKSPRDNYGAASLASEELASRLSYSDYHKVCDMGQVFPTTLIGIAGILLTFFLVFTSWCAWHESIEWVGVTYKLQGQSVVEFAAIVNAVAVAVLILLVVLMRYVIGPILSLTWRGVFASLLVLTAIAVWEALEAVVDMLLGTDPADRATFYLISCAVIVVVILVFEVVFRYDVVGNHLLVPA